MVPKVLPEMETLKAKLERGAEVDALRAEVADLRDKLAQVEAFLGRL